MKLSITCLTALIEHQDLILSTNIESLQDFVILIIERCYMILNFFVSDDVIFSLHLNKKRFLLVN